MEGLAALYKAQDIESVFQQYILPWSVNIVLAIIVLVVGRWITKRIVKFFRGVMERAEYDHMLINFLAATLQALLMIVVIVAALDRLGVATTSIVAVLGAAGVAVGLALQGSLQNFAAGIMILIFRPFRAGDYIEAGGSAGTVEKVGIFSTTMSSTDNKEVIVPNGNIYRDTITNYSARPTRRIDLVIRVGYDSDLKKAKELLNTLVSNEPRVLSHPEAFVAVSEMTDSSINFVVRPWVNTGDYLAVKCSLIETIKLEFDQEGIEIPYPQLDVHMANSP
ncbi:MAG: mechanosensitive ion channel [Acidiferrobacterales bacterium]|nr:mechanosensitive ion channel [Acidiferrobacterales bacterium]